MRILLLLAIVVMVTLALWYLGQAATRRSRAQERRIRELEEQVTVLAHEEVEREERERRE